MKKIILSILVISIIYGCANNSEEASIDCSQSDLEIVNISAIKSGCASPGSLTLSVVGGEAPYTYSIDGTNFQTSESFDGLFAGEFSIVVQDNIGCTTQTTFNLESEDTGISLSLSAENSDCSSSTGKILASATGGTGELQYSIDGGDFTNTNEFNLLGPGSYSVAVRDNEGCEVNKSIQIKTNTSLDSDIMPIISSNCAISGCHNGSVSPNLTTESSVISNASRVKSETQSGSMPRGRTLSETEIDLIACWVDDGANDN